MSGIRLYFRQFIRLLDGRIIPICLTGKDRFSRGERAARNWSVLALSRNDCAIALRPEELLGKACAFSQQEYIHTGERLDAGSLLNLVEEGIGEAMTLEQLQWHFPKTKLRCYLTVWANTGECSDTGQHLRESHEEGRSAVSTSLDLLEFLEMAERRIEARKQDESIAVTIGFSSHDSLYRMLRAGANAAKGGFYIIETDSPGTYAGRMFRSGSMCIEHSVQSARRFRTEPDAVDWLERYRSLYTLLSAGKIQFIAQEAEQKKKWVIQVNDGNQYIKRMTRGVPILTIAPEDARRFVSTNAASRWVRTHFNSLMAAQVSSFSYVKMEDKKQEEAA